MEGPERGRDPAGAARGLEHQEGLLGLVEQGPGLDREVAEDVLAVGGDRPARRALAVGRGVEVGVRHPVEVDPAGGIEVGGRRLVELGVGVGVGGGREDGGRRGLGPEPAAHPLDQHGALPAIERRGGDLVAERRVAGVEVGALGRAVEQDPERGGGVGDLVGLAELSWPLRALAARHGSKGSPW